MRYLTIVIACLFLGLIYVGEASGDELKATPRKVIKPPTTARPQSSQERRVVTPPATVRPQLPQGFGRPIQKPAGFGKQEWQKPQQPQQQQVRPSHNYRHGSIIIGRPYVHPFNYPSVETRFHPIYGFYRVYHPPVVNPYYNPQPFPVYPAPFHGFFFQFRW
tara:strand:- start:2355 stop:2840 length:486 start_codon:yes stop_codon:yes gene_type:complete